MSVLRKVALSIGFFAALVPATAPAAPIQLLNVSYDPTRELYQEINAVFEKRWSAQTKQQITLRQSHGGSGQQARAGIDGLPPDLGSLALGYYVDAIAHHRPLTAHRQPAPPHDSPPFYSTHLLLV